MKEIKLLVDDKTKVVVITAIGTDGTVTYVNTETIELAKLKNNTYKMHLFKEVNKNETYEC